MKMTGAALTFFLAVLSGIAVRAEEPSVVLRDAGPEGYQVEGRFLVQAPRAAAWAALTDYEHIEDFASSVRSSRVVERREDGVWIVEQKVSGKVYFFSRRMRLWLKVRERPMEEISFEDTSRKDFETYKGRWTIEEAGAGLRVTYRLTARPRFAAPDFLLREGFRKTAALFLEEIRREILRRASAERREREGSHEEIKAGINGRAADREHT